MRRKFDTAWIYQGSEENIKKALVDRYPRESNTLATKNAAWAGYFDYYLLHNLGQNRTSVFDKSA